VCFGEYCRSLRVVGDAFIKLLQVTVLPYITISLILGIGSLTGAQARALARKGGTLMLGFWAIALLMVVVMPLSFPHWQSAAFFSASLVEPPRPTDFLDLYIPSNPFRSLADNVVPAVVLFSLLVGIALMGVKEKSRLLRGLEIATEALGGVTKLIVRLAPVGFFAIVASATGTLGVEEFGRLHVFLLAYIVGALFLTFWLLPLLVTLATPFSYREVLGVSRDALIAAFVTGNLFVVLPVLTQRVKELFRQRALQRDTTESYVDVVVPVAFNFPNLGEVLLLMFVFFAAWFSGLPLTAGQYPGVLGTGLLSAFGSLNIAIPYLLDLLKLPADLFQLYLIAGLVTSWFATLLGAMGLLVFAILSVAALTGVAAVKRTRLAAAAGLTRCC
jgi:Na+/H+-dicarboxylate symporter